MADARCPTCGARVATVFEHVDVDCSEIDSAPKDGTVILGLFDADDRGLIRWEELRSHPGSDHSMGAGWADEEGLPCDPPEAWAPHETGEGSNG